MQFSSITTLAIAAIANALPAEEVGTITLTNYITKVVSQQTTYVPLAVSFYDEIKNTTSASNTTSSANATTTSSVSSNSTKATASAAEATTNGATVGAAGLGLIVGAVALML